MFDSGALDEDIPNEDCHNILSMNYEDYLSIQSADRFDIPCG